VDWHNQKGRPVRFAEALQAMLDRNKITRDGSWNHYKIAKMLGGPQFKVGRPGSPDALWRFTTEEILSEGWGIVG
jgi:hypothetical protein